MNERQDSQSRDDIEADCQYAPDRQPVLHPFQFSLQLFFFMIYFTVICKSVANKAPANGPSIGTQA